MGIPTVFITALPTIAQMVGANRIVRGVAITHPTGILVGRGRRASRCACGSSSARWRCSRPRSPRTVWEIDA
jgi:hypothetical protein